MPGPIEVFISYAPQDAELRRELEEHLKLLGRHGLIRSWHAEQIGPGQSWRTQINNRVSSAQLILLLISASFFASDDCHDVEMAKALDRWQRGEVQVVPILLRPCLWEETQLRRLLPLPDNRIPVTSWLSRDEAWANVARGIRQVVERMAQMQGAPIAPPPAPTIPERQSQVGPWAQRTSAPSYPFVPRPSQPSMQPELSPPRTSQPQPAAGRARSRWPQTILAMAAACCAAYLGALEVLPPPDAASPSISTAGAPPLGTPPATRSKLPAGQPVRRPSPSPTTPPTDSPARSSATSSAAEPGACRSPCCGGSRCAVDEYNVSKPVCVANEGQCRPCTSGRACITGSCDELLEPARPFMMRLAHATVRGQPPALDVHVCVRRSATSDPWTCTPYVQAADLPIATPASGMSSRLSVFTADMLTGRGIDIWVGRGNAALARHDGALHDKIGITALCVGLLFPLYDPANPAVPIGQIAFYLDDP